MKGNVFNDLRDLYEPVYMIATGSGMSARADSPLGSGEDDAGVLIAPRRIHLELYRWPLP